MKLKIKYREDGSIVRFCCLSDNIARQKQCDTDEILIDSGAITPEFYSDWSNYTVINKTVLPKLS